MTEVDEMNSAFFEDLLLVEEPGLEVCSLEKKIKLRCGTWKKETNLGVGNLNHSRDSQRKKLQFQFIKDDYKRVEGFFYKPSNQNFQIQGED